MENIQSASLWKRILALSIDLGILWIIGFIICMVFGDSILFLGRFKLLIGIVISTIYFGLSHSSISKGQTIGKKIFHLKVVQINGQYLSITKAFLRSAIFTIPYCFSDLINIHRGCSINAFQFFSYTLVPAILFINHAFIFTNPLRQCFYDFLLGTVVIEEHSAISISLSPVKNQKLMIVPIAAFLLIMIGSFVIYNPFSEENLSYQNEISEIEEKLRGQHDLHFSKLYYEFNKKQDYSKNLKIECFLTDLNKDLSSELYLMTEELDPYKDKFHIRNITLSVVKDMNIGIYSFWETLKKNEKTMKFNL